MPFSTTPSISLTLASEDFKNNIIYGPNNDVLYWIETAKPKLLGMGSPSPTFIYRPSARGGRDLVAEFQFHRISPATISYQGVTRELTDMFPKKGWLSS